MDHPHLPQCSTRPHGQRHRSASLRPNGSEGLFGRTRVQLRTAIAPERDAVDHSAWARPPSLNRYASVWVEAQPIEAAIISSLRNLAVQAQAHPVGWARAKAPSETVISARVADRVISLDGLLSPNRCGRRNGPRLHLVPPRSSRISTFESSPNQPARWLPCIRMITNDFDALVTLWRY